jgi:1,2-diacylglycerol 3-beta-galactosyltransferase
LRRARVQPAGAPEACAFGDFDRIGATCAAGPEDAGTYGISGAGILVLRRKIDLVYVDSGGGHRAAANALAEVIRGRGFDWDVRTVSIQDMLASIDVVHRVTGIPFQDIYNIMLRRGWTAFSAELIPLMHMAIRLFHRAQVRVLDRQWSLRRPDLVVSLIPHFNRAIKQSLDRACPGTELVTILTDIADYPPHFWIERQAQYVICGSDRAVAQARALGGPEAKVLRASGMIVHPRFYERASPDRARERARLGLCAERPTGLVLFGGEGSLEMIEIAQNLNRADSGVQLILLCGRHEALSRELSSMVRHIPMHVEGFTTRVPFYMELADFFIGKPGPGSISEAVVKRLPVIVRRDRHTLAHERYNCDWIEEQGIGLVIEGYDQLFDAVRQLLDPDRQAHLRQRLLEIRNEAVYEIPGMLENILEGARATPSIH